MANLDRDENTPRVSDDANARPAAGSQARATDWNTHDAFWRESFGTRPYAPADRGYSDYRQAYKYGHEAAFIYGYRPWDEEVEHDLERGWEQARADATLDWTQAKHAVRDAFERAREPGATP
jgi:hypothetical protein